MTKSNEFLIDKAKLCFFLQIANKLIDFFMPFVENMLFRSILAVVKTTPLCFLSVYKRNYCVFPTICKLL